MGKVTIRRFGIVRTATVAAVIYALLSLGFWLIIALPLALVAGTSSGGQFGAAFGAGAVGVLLFGLIATVAYAVIGWVMVALGCLVYNVAAGWVGGIEVEVSGLPPMGPGAGTPYGSPYAPAGYATPYGAPGYGGPAQPGAYPPVQQGGQPPTQPGSNPPPPPR